MPPVAWRAATARPTDTATFGEALVPAPGLDPGVDPGINLPTPKQIAAEVRRRPIGAVIADICRDLGILPNHPLWRDLRKAIMHHGGSYVRLLKDIITQPSLSLAESAAPSEPPAFPSSLAPASTGPP